MNRRQHAMFVIAHVLFILLAVAYVWACTEILRSAV